MIDIDKVKAAFATTTTFCQQSFYEAGKDGNPAAVCAVSALAVYAGMSTDLVGKFVNSAMSFMDFVSPILQVEYGIPYHVAGAIPGHFDDQENEWKGIAAVIKMFEKANEDEKNRPKPMLTTKYLTALFNSPAQFFTIDTATNWTWADDSSVAPIDAPIEGEFLQLAAESLGTDDIEHPGTLDVYAPSTSLVRLTQDPSQQIIQPAKNLNGLAAVKPQPLLIGSVMEWQ